MRFFYRFVIFILQPFVFLKLLYRSIREPLYRYQMASRFGFYNLSFLAKQPFAAKSPVIWIHAVSLGETRASASLIKALRQQIPDLHLLLTHGTATGLQAGKALLQASDKQAWLPWDSYWAVQQFLKQYRPSMGLILETELWPELISQCQQQNIPLCLVNGRLSEKTLHRTLKWGGSLMQQSYQQLFLVLPQSEADAERYRLLKANTGPALGNLKFDAEIHLDQQAIGKIWRQNVSQPILMLASSREGEETLFLTALKQHPLLQKILTDFQLLIVPRHPQRFNEVATIIEQAGFTVSRRSQWNGKDLAIPNTEASFNMPGFTRTSTQGQLSSSSPINSTIILGDSLGEMPIYYSASACVLMGGSFLPFGGQNLIEATLYGCPVIMGPSMYNFAAASQAAIDAGAAVSVNDFNQALACAYNWLEEHQLAIYQERATGFSQQHAGASQATASLLKEIYFESLNNRATSSAK